MTEEGGLEKTSPTDPTEVLQRVADQALALVPAADGAMIGLSRDGTSISYVCGSGRLAPFAGIRVDVGDSLSGLAYRTGQVLLTKDTETDSRVDREAARRTGVRSSVCIPLWSNHRPTGVLSVCSALTGAFDDADVALLGQLAAFIGLVVAAVSEVGPDGGPEAMPGGAPDPEDRRGRFVANLLSPGADGMAQARRRVEQVIRDDTIGFVFQPIVHLTTGEVFGLEALARFAAQPVRPPDAWFAEAESVGLGLELELLAVRKALAYRPSIPSGLALAINVGPAALASPRFAELVRSVDPRVVVVELTEHARVEDYPRLGRALMELRREGMRLAIDDSGAGFSSLTHILKLAPDLIKLDRLLTSGIDLDPVRRSLAAALVAFAAESGASIVAEGIETDDELQALRDLKIQWGQGYRLGRPEPLESLSTALGFGLMLPDRAVAAVPRAGLRSLDLDP